MKFTALALILIAATATAKGPMKPTARCTRNAECFSNKCAAVGRRHFCKGPAMMGHLQLCNFDADCTSHPCGLSPRTDALGGKRCLP